MSFPETDWKTCEAIAIASLPEIRITAIAPAPDGEAKATIVYCEIIFLNICVKGKTLQIKKPP